MANRVLRDWTTSELMDQLSEAGERLFTRLIMKADDFGSFYANPKLIRAALFPLKEISDAKITAWVDECVSVGLIFRYRAEGKEFIRIINFGQRLRNMRNTFPHPPENHSQQVAASRGESQRVAANSSESRPETKRNETETNSLPRPYTRDDYYQSPANAFEDIKSDELLVERLIRVVHGQGFRSCGPVDVMLAAKHFLTVEGAKEGFSIKPKKEVKSHLVNWINKNASKIHEYKSN